MRYFIVLIVVLLTNSLFGQEDIYTERILHYSSEIYVNKNSTIRVKEKIKVYALGQNILRGIYRELPTSYKYKGGNVHVDFKLNSVKRNGIPEPFHTESASNGVRIYAGEKDVFIENGVHEYELNYTVGHVLGYFEDFDELYWNINGNGWEFEIDSIEAKIYLPKGAQLVRKDGYTGSYGSKDKNFTTNSSANWVSFHATKALRYHENLSIAVAWDKNHVVYPTAFEEFVFWIKSYVLYIVGGLGILLGFILNFRTWYKFGRDPKPGTIIPRFYPPEGFSPAECAHLKGAGRVTNTFVGSTLINSAIKGVVKIEVDEGKGIFGKTKYTIRKIAELNEAKKPMNNIETSFFNALFSSKSVIELEKGKHNATLLKAKNKLENSIEKKQNNLYYLRNTHLKAKQFLMPLIIGVVGALAFFMFGGGPQIIVASVVVLIIMNVIFAKLYEQPTKLGREKMDEIAGFEMYLKYADKQRIKLMNPPTMNFEHFEENLAYAIALNVAEEWAGQFDPKELQSYSSGAMPLYHGMAFHHLTEFTNDFSNVVSSAATPPGQSGSGSGGGGFSGGGGGGGGGGGW
jgi:uncharacterized membrane protein